MYDCIDCHLTREEKKPFSICTLNVHRSRSLALSPSNAILQNEISSWKSAVWHKIYHVYGKNRENLVESTVYWMLFMFKAFRSHVHFYAMYMGTLHFAFWITLKCQCYGKCRKRFATKTHSDHTNFIGRNLMKWGWLFCSTRKLIRSRAHLFKSVFALVNILQVVCFMFVAVRYSCISRLFLLRILRNFISFSLFLSLVFFLFFSLSVRKSCWKLKCV